ncbi:hypothetical protein [Spiroplasma endosymbiont of Danaus chrysippus]|uniref:hypothetical protein n=1 Tax=Spiroplasma endosymbiont of Danaus chrysippus TaxID=2691041 RepID=UPI0013CDCA0C|nr:hypothetical protein [Spiroplasma endosymbiont of Danaus chrysippus]CAB1053838.1 hypothetical protein [Spiroplasma endosymbiont of Danaus chrysippus]
MRLVTSIGKIIKTKSVENFKKGMNKHKVTTQATQITKHQLNKEYKKTKKYKEKIMKNIDKDTKKGK